MGCQASGSGGLQSAINVTPLVDVVLVLLIILMVVVPLTLQGYDVVIPQEAVTAAAPASREPVVLVIDPAGCPALEPPGAAGLPAGCRVKLDAALVPLEELSPRISRLFADREPSERVLFLAAHERLNYEAVMRIVDVAQSAVPGLRIGIVGDGGAADANAGG